MRKNNKTFTYYDVETESYVTLALSLKDNIKDIDINSFFKFLYAMKLDTGYSNKRIFVDKKSTGDLVNEFQKILDSEVINLAGLSNIYDIDLLKKESQINLDEEDKQFNKLTARTTIVNFFNLFQINRKENYTDDEVNTIIRKTRYPQLSLDDKASIERLISEVAVAKENTKFIYALIENNLINVNRRNNTRNKVLAK